MHRRASHATLVHRKGFGTSHRGCASLHRVAGPYHVACNLRAIDLRLDVRNGCDGLQPKFQHAECFSKNSIQHDATVISSCHRK